MLSQRMAVSRTEAELKGADGFIGEAAFVEMLEYFVAIFIFKNERLLSSRLPKPTRI